MSETTPAPPEAALTGAATENAAVARCCEAYDRTLESARGKGKGRVFASIEAGEAYRKALPPLCGLENIRDFIACTAHGVLIGAIDGADAARLLYAAQVAQTTVRNPSGRPKSAA